MPAILAQSGDFTTYYADLLACSPASRPATWSLVLIGLQVGGLVAGRFKLDYMRPRPAQVWPAIAPAIDTPPHPAFPSGHALQAYLIAECVGLAATGMQPALEQLGEEIALNRERAGVHWPSDKKGSRDIIPNVMATLQNLVSFTDILEAAKKEWRPAKFGTRFSSLTMPAPTSAMKHL